MNLASKIVIGLKKFSQNLRKNKMVSEKGIHLKVDPNRRIGVDDVIDMLKGLRSDTAIDIIRIPGKTVVKKNLTGKDSSYSGIKSDTSSSVTGNTEIPQIRELNEIASLLRSMESKQNSFRD